MSTQVIKYQEAADAIISKLLESVRRNQAGEACQYAEALKDVTSALASATYLEPTLVSELAKATTTR